MEIMTKSLSSGLTLIFKIVFPDVWLTVFGAGTVLALLHPDQIRFNEVMGGNPHARYVFLAAWLAGFVFMAIFCFPLKSVEIDESGLTVSNYWNDLHVPFSMMSEVSEKVWVNIHPITITLHEDPGCGKQVVFIPPQRTQWRPGTLVSSWTCCGVRPGFC